MKFMNLPIWAPSLRSHQQSAIDSITAEFESGSDVVMLDAPTGAGKTLIAELVRQNLNARALYLCTTLALQDQFCRDFPEAALLRGRSNYPVLDIRIPGITAADCTKRRITFDKCKAPCPGCSPFDCECRGDCMHETQRLMHCQWCHPVVACPYEVAKYEAVQAELVCTNVAYFLYESNYIGALRDRRTLVIVDEADMLEEQLLKFCTLSISERQQREFGIAVPERKTVRESWIEWAEATHQHLTGILPAYKCAPNERDIRRLRRQRTVQQLHADIALLTDPDEGLATDNWVYTSYERGLIEFKPIRVDALAHSRLWRHAPRFLLMSATMISFAAISETLGI